MKHTYRVVLAIECEKELDHDDILGFIDVSGYKPEVSILITGVEETSSSEE